MHSAEVVRNLSASIIEDAWRRHTAAPFGLGFGIYGSICMKKYINKSKKHMKIMSANHTKNIPKIMKNRARRLHKS
jgi:hypothetical protein